MTNDPSSAPQRKFRVSSIGVGVALMGLAVILMLTGVLPTRDGGQEIVYRTPVFRTVMALLGLSLLACCMRRRLMWRSVGFLLVHGSVILILIGALLGAAFQVKSRLQLHADAAKPVQQVPLADGTMVDLGFGISMNSFLLDRYSPNLQLYLNGALEREYRLADDGVLRLGRAGTFRVKRMFAHAALADIQYEGTPELIITKKDGEEWQRIALDGAGREVPLDDGNILIITRVYNNLPSMQMGQAFHETGFPAKPGLILHYASGNRIAILSLAAGQEPQILSASDAALADEIPGLLYAFPRVVSMDLRESPDRFAPFAVELEGDDGTTVSLVEKGGPLGSMLLHDGYAIKLSRASDRSYAADLVIHRGETATPRALVINSPLVIDGWRFYLEDYNPQTQRSITVTVRKDPGNGLVVVGILALMIGIPTIFYSRRHAS